MAASHSEPQIRLKSTNCCPRQARGDPPATKSTADCPGRLGWDAWNGFLLPGRRAEAEHDPDQPSSALDHHSTPNWSRPSCSNGAAGNYNEPHHSADGPPAVVSHGPTADTLTFGRPHRRAEPAGAPGTGPVSGSTKPSSTGQWPEQSDLLLGPVPARFGSGPGQGITPALYRPISAGDGNAMSVSGVRATRLGRLTRPRRHLSPDRGAGNAPGPGFTRPPACVGQAVPFCFLRQARRDFFRAGTETTFPVEHWCRARAGRPKLVEKRLRTEKPVRPRRCRSRGPTSIECCGGRLAARRRLLPLSSVAR